MVRVGSEPLVSEPEMQGLGSTVTERWSRNSQEDSCITVRHPFAPRCDPSHPRPDSDVTRSRESPGNWKTADLARIGDGADVWELSTFWDGPDGTAMATLERLAGDQILTAHSPVADLHRTVDTRLSVLTPRPPTRP